MTPHDWSTYGCSDSRQRDECLRCGAQRVRKAPNWQWRYVEGDDTCAVPQDLSPDEKRLTLEGTE